MKIANEPERKKKYKGTQTMTEKSDDNRKWKIHIFDTAFENRKVAQLELSNQLKMRLYAWRNRWALFRILSMNKKAF